MIIKTIIIIISLKKSNIYFPFIHNHFLLSYFQKYACNLSCPSAHISKCVKNITLPFISHHSDHKVNRRREKDILKKNFSRQVYIALAIQQERQSTEMTFTSQSYKWKKNHRPTICIWNYISKQFFFSKVSHPADTSVSLSMIKKNTQKYGYFTVSTYVSTETSPYKKNTYWFIHISSGKKNLEPIICISTCKMTQAMHSNVLNSV